MGGERKSMKLKRDQPPIVDHNILSYKFSAICFGQGMFYRHHPNDIFSSVVALGLFLFPLMLQKGWLAFFFFPSSVSFLLSLFFLAVLCPLSLPLFLLLAIKK